MRVIHSEIVGLPEFLALAPALVTGHCFGEGNPCADLASRGRFAELAALCAALGVTPRRVDLTQAALDFVARVRQRSLSALEAGRTTAHGQMLASPFAHGGARMLLAGVAASASPLLGDRALPRSLSALEAERTTAHGQMLASPFALGGARMRLAGLASSSSPLLGARARPRSLSALEAGRTTAHGQMLASPFAHGGASALLATLAVSSPSPCSARVQDSVGLGLQAIGRGRADEAASALVDAHRAVHPAPCHATGRHQVQWHCPWGSGGGPPSATSRDPRAVVLTGLRAASAPPCSLLLAPAITCIDAGLSEGDLVTTAPATANAPRSWSVCAPYQRRRAR